MTELASTLAWIGLIIYLSRLVTPAVTRLGNIMERQLALREEVVKNKVTKQEPIPLDLLTSIGYSDAWAREQAMQKLREMYAEYGSWDNVRAAQAHTRVA